MDHAERDMHFFALLAQVQVIDATVAALIDAHPEPDVLRERMRSMYAIVMSELSVGLIAQGASAQYLSALQEHMDKFLTLQDE
ncbi:hypothetical protein [Dyella mobilis]|uniref:TetR family transcriptional regulator n=1 Tax=Dyella mobilis TaxID=1849582 RepID=A0ABS2KKZ3_9GAMM|nr:hypothetical protein [Dyella mobilis]MBM7131584.1 hypothetical protein [Dyella mobilis]GLQ96443.1 hypothetical protein GCM10007863_08610 [Dyella mobilis]